MTRRPYLSGNWKMHGGRARAAELARGLRERIGSEAERDVAVFPPFLAIETVRNILDGSSIRVGGQTCHTAREGAYTGEVSAEMLADAGAGLVLVGHSERRQLFGETDAVVREKLEAALRAGLEPTLCVGESRTEREAGRTEQIVETQMIAALENLPAEGMAKVTIAYEPVWAIGTGLTATPGQAHEVHAFLRRLLASLHGPELAASTRIQYGGSVKPDNIAGLMREPDIDGALVGGASLDVESFSAIVRYGRG